MSIRCALVTGEIVSLIENKYSDDLDMKVPNRRWYDGRPWYEDADGVTLINPDHVIAIQL